MTIGLIPKVASLFQGKEDSMKSCRCGFQGGTDPHPCHGKGYTCGKPAEQRFYNPHPAALAGMQMKLVVDDTWACDACWTEFQEMMAKARKNADGQ